MKCMLPVKYIKLYCTACLAIPLLVTAQGIRIPDGAYMIANTGNIVTQNNWINNGTFTHIGGTVVFAGNAQQIGGTKGTTFNKLTINAGSNTSIVSSGHSLKYILKSDGILNANNNLTLLAGSAQTALIDGSGIGEVWGKLTMQGYLSYGFGYKYLGSPFQAATVNEMADEVDLNASFPSVYRHDENQASNGWINYTNPADTLFPMRGYVFQMGNSPAAKTINMSGVVNNGNLSLSLSNNNQVYTKGFNLVSNPYPSPIDWDAATGWTRTNIDNAIYYFDAGGDQYAGAYNSYINGISNDGKANNLIPAMQGFFVHVSDGSFPVAGTLGFSNTVRIIPSAQNYRKLNGIKAVPLLRLWAKFTGSTAADATVMYFDKTATAEFDKHLDAMKLMNSTTHVPSFYSIKTGSQKLSIHALPEPDSSTRIPLGLQTLQSGQLSLYATDIDALPANLYCYLYDAATGVYHDLKENKSYECTLAAGSNEQRLSVIFSRSPILQQQVPAEPASSPYFQVSGSGRNIVFTLTTMPGEKAVIRIINTAGQVLSTQTYTKSGTYPFTQLLPQGIYYVSCYTANTVITKKIFTGQ